MPSVEDCERLNWVKPTNMSSNEIEPWGNWIDHSPTKKIISPLSRINKLIYRATVGFAIFQIFFSFICEKVNQVRWQCLNGGMKQLELQKKLRKRKYKLVPTNR